MDASTLFTRLETATASFRNLERQLADPDVAADPKRLESIARERSRLEPLVLDFEELQKLESERDSARQLLKDSRGDAAMEELAQDELASLQEQHATLTERLTLALLPRDPRDERSVMLEIRAGAGGDEACLWAGDLARMYERYSQKVGWTVQSISCTEADLGSEITALVRATSPGAEPTQDVVSAGRVTTPVKVVPSARSRRGRVRVLVDFVPPRGLAVTPTGRVSIKVGSRTKTVPLRDGKVRTTLGKRRPMRPGQRRVVVTYTGDRSCNPSQRETTVEIVS